MNTPFVSFQKYTDPAAARALGEFLGNNGFEYKIHEDVASFNVTFVNNELNKEYWVKLKKDDFKKAKQLLLENAKQELETIDKDYYLYSFSNEELVEIINNPDQWSVTDWALAQKILKENGIDIKTEYFDSAGEKRVEELRFAEKIKPLWIVFGYIAAILGSVGGWIIGHFIWSHKKTLPNGEVLFVYTKSDRAHGKRIFIISIIFLIAHIILWAFGFNPYDRLLIMIHLILNYGQI